MARTGEKEYYTVPQVAERLEVSPVTVWRWIETGKLPAYRVGPRNIRVRKEDLEAMIRPVRAKEAIMDKGRRGIWAGYDPEKVREAVEKTAGSWADLDTNRLITDLYRAREEGTRPRGRP